MDDINQPVEANEESPTAPVKVCRRCSVQSETDGDYCANCGASYLATSRRPSKRTLLIIAAVVTVLVLGGVGYALKARHDANEKREAAAAQRATEAAAAKKAEEEAEAAALEAEEAAAAEEDAERELRAAAIKELQKTITKDAKERVGRGELEGPIFNTQCTPLGGGSVDDLTALTTTFECLAVNEKLKGGQVRGWIFSSTMN